MGGGDPPVSFGDERGQADRASLVEDRVRRLDHQLHAQRSRGEVMRRLDAAEGLRQRAHLRSGGDLRQRDDEVRRQLSAGFLQQPLDEEMGGPERPLAELVTEVLDPHADERRQRAVRVRRGDFDGRGLGVAVLFGVRAVAVAVLEVQPEVLDRLASQLLDHARMDARGRRRREAERGGERGRIGRVLVQGPQRRGAEARRGVRLEEVRAAVHHVNRLPPMR